MRSNLWLTTLAVVLASPAFGQALSTPQTPQTQTGATPPPAAAPQTTGGQVMSQSPSGATSTLPTDKGTAGGNSGTSGGNSSGSKQ